LQYIASLPEEKQLKTLGEMIFQEMRKIDGIADKDIKNYIVRVIESLSPQHIAGIKENPFAYANKIKEKIEQLMVIHSEKRFSDFLDRDKVYVKPVWSLPPAISPSNTTVGITKSLYEEEGDMNDFEKKVINEIANCENILRWHRNIERK
jgi:type III restriction enzyme